MASETTNNGHPVTWVNTSTGEEQMVRMTGSHIHDKLRFYFDAYDRRGCEIGCYYNMSAISYVDGNETDSADTYVKRPFPPQETIYGVRGGKLKSRHPFGRTTEFMVFRTEEEAMTWIENDKIKREKKAIREWKKIEGK